MKKFILLFGILLVSCATTREFYIIERSALINAHDYKYAYLIGRRVYKSNQPCVVGDTLKTIPEEFLRIH